MRLSPGSGFVVLASALLLACGGTFESAGTGGDAGTGGSTATGGASTGGTSTGGAATGGNGNTGGAPVGECLAFADCLAAADLGDPCFSPDCSLPIAASYADLAQNSCLVPWEERYGGRPQGCSAPKGDVACPAMCAMPPTCVAASCEYSQCTLKMGYSEEECSLVGDCDDLQAELDKYVTLARACEQGSACTGEVTVPYGCAGCPVPVADRAMAEKANTLYKQIAETCLLNTCDMACIEPPSREAICSPDGICVWAKSGI